jgi:hypothetical protein
MPPAASSLASAAPSLRAAPRNLRGKTTPRLFTPPLRQLSRRTSNGYYVADFAEAIGTPLQPWQRWAAIHAMELLPGGEYRFKIVLVIVARQNGKSNLKRAVTLWRMYMQPRCRVLGIAQDLSLARDQWQMCQDTIQEDADLLEEWGGVRNVNGDEKFWLANKALYAIKAPNRKAGRGGSNDEVNIDELREHQTWKPWAAVSKTTMARPNSQIWCMSNAGDDTSVVLNRLRDRALTGDDPTIGLFEWSGAYDDDGDSYCAIDDWAQIAQANPVLGSLISAAAIGSSMSNDPPDIYRTEVLCQRVRQIDGAISMIAWGSCSDPGVTMDSLRTRLCCGFDVAPDDGHATLAVAARTGDGKIRGEIVKSWPSAMAARAELPAILARIRPCVVTWFPAGPAAALAPIMCNPGGRPVKLEKAGPGRTAWVELTGADVAKACQGLGNLIKGRQILHNNDPLLKDHLGAATRRKVGDGWVFARRPKNPGNTAPAPDPGEDPAAADPAAQQAARDGAVDAAYAFAGAVHGALILPEPARARIRLLA